MTRRSAPAYAGRQWARLLLPVALAACGPGPAPDAATTYAERCASCHGARRYGGYAPPLIPRVLARRSDAQLAEAILRGLPSTQMPGFAAEVDEAGARALVALMRAPAPEIRWAAADISASREEYPVGPATIPPSVRRENLILVVERGSGDVAVLDGDALVEVDRFQIGRMHGGAKFDRRYRSAYAATRDGTLVRYDLERGGLRVRAKVAVNTRNVAIAPDGDVVVAANQLPPNLVALDGDLQPLQSWPLPGQPSGVYWLPGASRFVLTLRDAPALYTLEYPGLELARVELPEPFEDFVFLPDGAQLLASSRAGRRILLWDLAAQRIRGALETEALPHLFSACFFTREGVRHAAVNHVGVPRLSIIDLEAFRIAKEIPLAGAGFFVRTHPGTPYLWADTNTEAIQLVDKGSLALLERPLVPAPGKTAMHVEFTADGSRALVSVWHPEGAVVAYDATSLAEVARLPYALPVGKYNAFNKTRSAR